MLIKQDETTEQVKHVAIQIKEINLRVQEVTVQIEDCNDILKDFLSI